MFALNPHTIAQRPVPRLFPSNDHTASSKSDRGSTIGSRAQHPLAHPSLPSYLAVLFVRADFSLALTWAVGSSRKIVYSASRKVCFAQSSFFTSRKPGVEFVRGSTTIDGLSPGICRTSSKQFALKSYTYSPLFKVTL